MFDLDELVGDLKKIGLKSNDRVLIHSSFKSINTSHPLNVIKALEKVVSNGLIIYPTHTWSYIKDDGDEFHKFQPNSCVGVITNEAIKLGYKRSNHPTHSVCVKGVDEDEYIHLDDCSNTPCNPNGCHGILKNGGKILFIGAKLSKNTFIHSVEEYMGVLDRFTEKKYLFKSIGNKIIEYNMYRHFNKSCPHISDNYEKLKESFLELNIGVNGKIGDADSFLLDSKKVFDYTTFLLSKDIHLFDDDREIKREYIDEYKKEIKI